MEFGTRPLTSFTPQRYNNFCSPQHFYKVFLKSRNHCHGMGAWATADMRGGARLKGGVSALSVRSGATRKRSEAGSVCLRTKALRDMTLMHLGRPCGWPVMSA